MPQNKTQAGDLLRETQEVDCLCLGVKQPRTEGDWLYKGFIGTGFSRVGIPRVGIGEV